MCSRTRRVSGIRATCSMAPMRTRPEALRGSIPNTLAQPSVGPIHPSIMRSRRGPQQCGTSRVRMTNVILRTCGREQFSADGGESYEADRNLRHDHQPGEREEQLAVACFQRIRKDTPDKREQERQSPDK